MTFDPSEMREIEFRRPPLGKRGYAEDEVNAFLLRAHEEFVRLIEENREMRQRLYRDDLTAEIDRLSAEQATAEQRAAGIRAELDRLRGETAQEPALINDRFVAMARRTGDEYVRDAREEAEKLLTNTVERAERLLSEASLRASTIDSDARHRHAREINSLTGQRAAAIREINELDEYARAYRDRLSQLMTARLTELLEP
ncbi:DivIVA domain-containing protein [Actinoplanes octamycinicus]|uniref:Cell wall synthesis protein Wag31 n=1 Tax=Actinoplanes octamycinicus TaxID=135948 RepID=A0A7W7H444_9ACTN|nr:DivIVA domain-containing protein [Actinoplanes octamycinicus]MBB4743650.1 DivIVA domain-containing protein [Actinoplanes octamycinicus]GIE61075.1 cell division initiation protein [Actinoplanes octamycinicus]